MPILPAIIAEVPIIPLDLFLNCEICHTPNMVYAVIHIINITVVNVLIRDPYLSKPLAGLPVSINC